MAEQVLVSLRKISLFADLSEDMLGEIASKIEEHPAPKGTLLFREGQEGNSLYFIQSGEIEIYDETEDHKEITLTILKAGEYFGEMALLEDKPRSASARAIADSVLLTLDRQNFLALLESNAKLAVKMTSVISARLRTSQPVEQTQKATAQTTSSTKVFISYSRKDKLFVQQLNQAISGKGIDTWVDWENIPLTADWWHEIQTGIENADAFAFVISPDSLNSEVCGREIQTAVDNHKRLIPILHREPQKGDPMHAKISSHNWVYMRAEEEMHTNLNQMLEIVNTDLGWVRQHTRLRERALEWERTQKNPSFLLQGTDLQNAEQWLEKAGRKDPQPTALHIEYIQASRRVSTLRQRALLTYTFVGLAITLVLAIISFVSYLQARSARKNAEASAATAQAAYVLAENNLNIAQTEQVKAVNAQATAEAERNIAATAQAEAETQEFLARAGRLESMPLTMLNTQLDLALLLSIEAYRFNPTLSSEATLFTAWSHNPELLRYLQGHTHAVQAVAWAPDRQLATGGEDGIIILWDSQKGVPIREFQPVEGEILELKWSPDGQLASGDSAGNVIVWNPATGTPAQILAGHTGDVHAIAWSLRNELTSGGEDGQIIVWNLQRGQPQSILSKTGASIYDLDWSRTGVLASANSDHTITIWGTGETEDDFFDTEPFSSTQSLPPDGLTLFQSDVQTVAWSPEGELVSGGFQEIILWDLFSGEPRLLLEGHSLFVNSLAWSERGELASGASDNTVIIWDLDNGRPKKTFRGHSDWVQAVDWSSDGILASAALDNTIILWHPNERPGIPLRGHEGWVTTVAYSPESLLVSGDEDGGLILWDLETRRPEKTLIGHEGFIYNLDWSPDGQFASGGIDRQVILWNLASGAPAHILLGHNAAIADIEWSPGGQLATSDVEGTLIVWDLASELPKWRSDGQGTWVAMAWSPNEELTLGSEDGTIIILDANTFEPAKTLFSEEDAIHQLAWSPDGKLVSDGRNYQLLLWNLDTGQPEMRLRGHSNTISALAWSAEGRLASSAEDSTIIIWDLEGSKPAFVLRGHISPVLDLSWSPDGKQLASASSDTTVIVWDVTPEAWMLRNCSRAGRNFRPEEWATFFPDGDYTLTCPQWANSDAP